MIGTNGNTLNDLEFEAISDGGFSLFAGRQEGKWGYFSFSGLSIIPPQFEFAGPFFALLAPVKEAGKDFGYINDESGGYTIKPQFKTALPFYSYNRGLVETTNGWGIIDRKGSFVLRPEYPYLGVMDEEDLIAVDCFGDTYYIDERGNRLLPAGFNPLEGRVRGREFVQVKLGGDWAKRTFWFIPLYVWEERGAELMASARARVRYQKSQETSDQGTLRLYNQVYTVVSEKDGLVQTNQLDVLPPGPINFKF